MSESEFLALAEATLTQIEAALDRLNDEDVLDVECSRSGNVLEIEFIDNGTKIIVNSQAPMREMWVAARSGGFHFGARDGRWRDTRTGATLDAALGELLLAQAGLAIELPLLPAPAGR